MRSRRVLFAVHDWGLGHATRCLVLIRALVERGDEVTVLMAPSPGLQLLKAELGQQCTFYPYPDIPKPLGRSPPMFYAAMTGALPLIWARFKREHRLTERLVRKHRFERVITDSRLGVWSRTAPSYCIFHSLRQIVPGRSPAIERLVERGQRRLLKPYRKVLIPDFAENGGLSGDLGHDPQLDWGAGRLVYIGPLSGVRRQNVPEDIDYFFSLSGLEPQRSLLEQRVQAALPRLSGRIVVARGRLDAAGDQEQKGNATIYGYLDRHAQAEMLNRARLVFTRSGYTTLMELAELGKRALLVPTPGQSEQEYLAQFHHERGHAWSTTQRRLDIVRDLARAQGTTGIPQHATADSVQRFLDAIS
ncbi:glycosyltransferase [Salinisphaera sp.]|uniref:glycosyltransferase n=1 Tax=Salinisphaera sp. TaxID=1914330 RepID=UPI002D77D3D4|nr:glycosyltransferase [Salinisphaera sp.]HET7315568.1 glycosyltransferase [Salinisphaera sp.]